MTFVPIIDPSALWEEEEDTGLIASSNCPTFESDTRRVCREGIPRS